MKTKQEESSIVTNSKRPKIQLQPRRHFGECILTKNGFIFIHRDNSYISLQAEVPVLRVKHKNHIPKVMFLAALGEPTDSFDGSVGIWPVLEEFQPLRAAVSHPRVNLQLVPYMKSATMDGDLFVKMICESYLPKISQ